MNKFGDFYESNIKIKIIIKIQNKNYQFEHEDMDD